MTTSSPVFDKWLEALHARHVAPYRPKEFTHALQALSVRYVERRKELGSRSPLDSAGKRAAFAAFYAPLHFLTVQEVLREVAGGARPARIADLGCGTGVCGAAWAIGHGGAVTGVDDHQWAVDEARWNLKTLGIAGRASRGNLTSASISTGTADAIVLGWAVNELSNEARQSFLPTLVAFVQSGGALLIVEPLSHAVTPWWREWADAFAPLGGRADEWKFRVDLPPMLRELSQRAGFKRESLSAKTLAVRTNAQRSVRMP